MKGPINQNYLSYPHHHHHHHHHHHSTSAGDSSISIPLHRPFISRAQPSCRILQRTTRTSSADERQADRTCALRDLWQGYLRHRSVRKGGKLHTQHYLYRSIPDTKFIFILQDKWTRKGVDGRFWIKEYFIEYLTIFKGSFWDVTTCILMQFYLLLEEYITDIFKQTSWPLVRKLSILTELPPLLGEILCQLLRIEGCRVVSAADTSQSLISVF
jgi:hypothetical protein